MTTDCETELKRFSLDAGIDHRILFAILDNESNQNGFYENGEIKVRFENHIFNEFLLVYDGRHTRHAFLPKYDYDWVHKHSLSDLKLLSTSFGIAQIMGYHYEMLLHYSVGNMVKWWQLSELNQVIDFIHFCSTYRSGKFMIALRDLDFDQIAKMYNGSGYKKNNYHIKLKKYFPELS